MNSTRDKAERLAAVPCSAPNVPRDIAALIEESGMEWKWVGGQTVGLEKPCYRWQLCQKGALLAAKQRASELMRLAAACRLISEMLPMVADGAMKDRATRFLRSNA